MHWQKLRALVGLGIRIADIDQNLRGNVFNPDGSLEESVSNDLQIRGAGPTASLWLSRGFGGTRWGWYGSGRGSLLVSETEQRIYEMKGRFATELEDIAIQREIIGNVELGVF